MANSCSGEVPGNLRPELANSPRKLLRGGTLRDNLLLDSFGTPETTYPEATRCALAGTLIPRRVVPRFAPGVDRGRNSLRLS